MRQQQILSKVHDGNVVVMLINEYNDSNECINIVTIL